MGQTASTRRTLVVDGNNVLVRAIKAMEGRAPLSAGGVWTAPLLVYINCLSRYIREVDPHSVVVCWDSGRSEYRLGVYEGYKSNRVRHEEDDESTASYFLSREFNSLAGIHQVSEPHVEGDDLVAAYCHRRESNERIYILSGDKDFLMLLDGWVEQIRPGSSDDERWTANRVRTEMKCRPEHLRLVMAITGDPLDGVPGVPGFGHKTACKFLAKYDWDLEALLDANEVRLFGYRSDIERNLRLVDLTQPIPGITVERAPTFRPTTMGGALFTDFLAFLDRYQMNSVREKLLADTLWSVPKSA